MKVIGVRGLRFSSGLGHRCVTDPGSLPHWAQRSGEASARELAPKVPGNGLSGDLSSVMESSGGGYRWGNKG